MKLVRNRLADLYHTRSTITIFHFFQEILIHSNSDGLDKKNRQ